MAGKATRERNLHSGTQAVIAFAKQHQFKVKPLNYGYQLRIEDTLDVYPVNRRWHWLPTGERGQWNGKASHLKHLFLERLPKGEIKVVVSDKPTGERNDTATALANHILNKPEAKLTIWVKMRRSWRRIINGE